MKIFFNKNEKKFLNILSKWDFCVKSIKEITWLSEKDIVDIEEKFVREWLIKKHSIIWINEEEKRKWQTPYTLTFEWRKILYAILPWYKSPEIWTMIAVFLTAIFTWFGILLSFFK